MSNLLQQIYYIQNMPFEISSALYMASHACIGWLYDVIKLSLKFKCVSTKIVAIYLTVVSDEPDSLWWLYLGRSYKTKVLHSMDHMWSFVGLALGIQSFNSRVDCVRIYARWNCLRALSKIWLGLWTTFVQTKQVVTMPCSNSFCDDVEVMKWNFTFILKSLVPRRGKYRGNPQVMIVEWKTFFPFKVRFKDWVESKCHAPRKW